MDQSTDSDIQMMRPAAVCLPKKLTWKHIPSQCTTQSWTLARLCSYIVEHLTTGQIHPWLVPQLLATPPNGKQTWTATTWQWMQWTTNGTATSVKLTCNPPTHRQLFLAHETQPQQQYDGHDTFGHTTTR
jgi:hypothetical protein